MTDRFARALFDEDFYRRQISHRLYPWTDPFNHYIKNGAHFKLDPNSYFSTSWYLAKHKSVQDTGIHPLIHYVTRGFSEGYDPSDRFSTRWYLLNNADVRRSCINPLEHFLRHGKSEGRSPKQPRGVKAFRDRKLDLPESLFDDEWYGRKYAETSGLSALCRYEHYVQIGASLGYDPNAFLCSQSYAHSLESGLGAYPNSLSHFFFKGARLGLNPGPLFDTKWYIKMNPDVSKFGYNPLAHFLLYGQIGTECPHPIFLDEAIRPLYNYAAVSQSFDPSDVTNQIAGCFSFRDLLSGKVLSTFSDSDHRILVIAPVSPIKFSTSSPVMLENAAVIAGFSGFVSGGSVNSLGAAPRYSGGLKAGVLMHVCYYVSPAFSSAIHLFTDSMLPLKIRIEVINSRLGRLASCLKNSVIMVEDDLPEDTYRLIRRAGGPNRRVIRIGAGTVCRVSRLDVSLLT